MSNGIKLNANGCPDLSDYQPETRRRILQDFPEHCQPIEIVVRKGGQKKDKGKRKTRRANKAKNTKKGKKTKRCAFH